MQEIYLSDKIELCEEISSTRFRLEFAREYTSRETILETKTSRELMKQYNQANGQVCGRVTRAPH